jgi:hypothetical protein
VFLSAAFDSVAFDPGMLTAHHTVAFLVLGVTWAAAILAGVAYYRRREPLRR